MRHQFPLVRPRTRRAHVAAGLAGIAALLLSSPSAVRGQVVHGAVATDGRVPMPGVVVTLLDATSTVVARALTNERGEYRLLAPSAGTYRVRTLRIGYRPALSEPIVLGVGQDATRALTVSSIAFALDTVRVADESSCRLASDSAAATFAVWEQARAALTATQLTAGDARARTLQATLVSFDRVLDGDFRRVKDEHASVSTGFVSQPWRELAPDSLHRAGYVWEEPNGIVTYNAPGLDALLSPGFVGDHCFRLVRARDPRLVGVAFAPTKARARVAEIEGTLWLDRATSELRSLDYRYANVPRERAEHAGGEMAFARMRDGGWAIAHWAIRMPVLASFVLPNGKREARAAEVHVTGGELALAMRAGVGGGTDTLYARAPLAVTGAVVDSATGAPVPNARVALVGTAMRATADGAGRFTIGGVLPGSYDLEVRTAALDSVGTVYRRPVDVIDSAATVSVQLPAARAIVGSLCRNQLASDRDGIVLGVIYARGDSTPRPNVAIAAEWYEFALGTSTVARTPKWREARSDAGGRFVLCGVPRNTAITVRASDDAAGAAKADVRLASDERVGRVSITLDPHEAIVGALVGVVLADSTKAPIAGAEVQFPELGRSVRTDSSGAFRLVDVPIGERQLSVRRVGYGPLDTRVTLKANRTLERTVYLAKVATLEKVVVTEKRRDLVDFEENRKVGLGRFLTREDLEKVKVEHLGDVFERFVAVKVQHAPGNRAYVASQRGIKSMDPTQGCRRLEDDPRDAQGCECYANLWLDGVQLSPREAPNINRFTPDQLEAIEYYAGAAQTPARYSDMRSHCGTVVLHTRRYSADSTTARRR